MLPLLCAACVSTGPELAEDEIARRSLWLPDGARAGMFVTWRTEDDGDVVEETVACVGEAGDAVTMEWREARRDGSREVVAARICRDGTVLGAWRGPEGGAGRPLKLVGGDDFDLDGAEKEVERLGYSTKDAKTETSQDREVVETPAGRFPCVRSRTKVSFLVFSGTFTAWYAEDPLPLSRLVKSDMDLPLGSRITEELVAYGTTGATPTLAIPP